MSENRSDNGTESCDSYYNETYNCSKLNDLLTGTRWVSGTGLPHWAQIEWTSSNHITEVGFYAGTSSNGEHFTEYYIEHWNGGDWVEDVHVTSYSDEYPTRTSHNVDFTTTKARMRMVAGNAYSALYELEFIGEEVVMTFSFTDPSPIHLSTVYGNSQTLQLTVTISGAEESYTYDATFYDATTSGIISTVSGTSSGQSVSTNWSTVDGGEYFWYLTASSSGSNDTSSTYEFTKKYKCAGYVEIDSTRASGVPVRLYRRSNGELMGSTTSAGISGTFEVGTLYNENHYAIAIHPTDSGTNALIYDWITP